MPSAQPVSNRSSPSLGRSLAASESIPSGVHATESLMRVNGGDGRPSTALSKSLLALFFMDAGAAVAVRHRRSMAFEGRPGNSRRPTPNPRPMQRPRTHWQPWRADRWNSVPTNTYWPYPQRLLPHSPDRWRIASPPTRPASPNLSPRRMSLRRCTPWPDPHRPTAHCWRMRLARLRRGGLDEARSPPCWRRPPARSSCRRRQ